MARKDKRPYVIIDSCFVLNPVNRGKYEEFLENCITLKYIKNARVRIHKNVLREVSTIIEMHHSHELRAVRALDSLREIFNKTMYSETEELTHKWLKCKALEVGTRIAKIDEREPPSGVDCEVCAYALMKLKKADVVIATRDGIIQRTAMTLYRPTLNAYSSIGIGRRYLEVRKDMLSLKERLNGFIL